MTRTWSAVYVYLHRSRADIDSFLLEHLAPHAEELVAAGHAEAWFYLRYWDGGPHLRARFLNADGEAVARFADRMRALAEKTSDAALDLDSGSYYANLPRADPARWHADGDVVVAGDRLSVNEAGAVQGGFDLGSAADRVKVEVLNGAGRVIDTLELGAQAAGRHGFGWTPRAGVDPAAGDRFFALAAVMIRRILVDHARRRQALKRGGLACRVELDAEVRCPPERLPAELVRQRVGLEDSRVVVDGSAGHGVGEQPQLQPDVWLQRR